MPEQIGGFFSRLLRNTFGNTLAIAAAAMVPLVGLIGGGVDISRIYLVKTRLQQACDAGALSGRKAMGGGNWTAAAETTANGLFTSNFVDGDYGTSGLTKDYDEDEGTVTGTASVDVPMTLMQVFGVDENTVSVSCTAKMEIPNTDVMFVLDMTTSMNCEPGCQYAATEESDAKVKDLRSAVNCFYEALMKVNTTEPCTAPVAPSTTYTSTGDPTATSYTGTAQIRLGVVPYAVNVNVGKLLPHSMIADNWNYQTRQVNTQTVWTWDYNGSETAITYGSWSPSSTPSSYNHENDFGSNNDSNWSVIGSSSITINGTTYQRQKTSTAGNSTNCTSSYNSSNPGNVLSGSSNSLAQIVDTGEASPSVSGPTSSTPTHNGTTGSPSQTYTYTKTDERTVTAYRYRYYNPPGSTYGTGCWFETANATSSYDRESTGTSSRPITWAAQTEVNNYTYDQLSLNVSGLKNADGSTWNASVSLPLGTTTSASQYRKSGSTSLGYLTIPANSSVGWDGCIEELPTYQNTNASNIASDFAEIPATAYDMQIDPASGSQWGPLLPDTFWGRYNGTAGNAGSVQVSSYTTPTDLSRNMTWVEFGITNTSYYCPQEARKLTEYATPESFVNYINGLVSTGVGTHHDIGLIWGARLLSPTGIFASENALTPEGGNIERHLIFMTDGNAATWKNNLSAYGTPYWDRRLTSYSPSTTNLANLINARAAALCTKIKAMNITLWVISYGGSVSSADNDRLEDCASSGKFFLSTNKSKLLQDFQQIASEIADLRLTT